jgi:hypothetical protein
LKKGGARPQRIEMAPHDGTPIYIGLGSGTQFDLRVTFPGQQPRAWHNVEIKGLLHVTPDGIK